MSTQGYSYLSPVESTVNVRGLSVEFVHPNGERRTLPVEAIAPTYVSVRWGMSGFYDLNLKVNKLTARSGRGLPKQPRKKAPCLWTAADIMAVREMVNSYYDREAATRKAEITRHAASMPHATEHPAIVSYGRVHNDTGDVNQNMPLDNRRGKHLK
jgi:hypothetical protein